MPTRTREPEPAAPTALARRSLTPPGALPPAAGSPLDPLRSLLARHVRRLLIGDDLPPGGPGMPDGRAALAPTTDANPLTDGLFGPRSVTWRIHQDASMLIGGLRALLYQTVHPLAMAGVAEHSTYRSDPLGRLRRTGQFVGVTTFGSTAEAEAAIAAVRRIHARVRGTAADGRPYRANDPRLLAWVHHTEVDSFLRAYRRYGAPLSEADADRYVEEMAEIGRRLGARDVATSTAALRTWLYDIRPELRGGPLAREASRFLLAPPLAPALRVAHGLIAAAAVGMLPRHVRRHLWLPVLPVTDAVAVRPAALAFSRALRWVMHAPVA